MDRDILVLIGMLYQAVLQPELWSQALHLFAETFRASHAILATGDPAAGPPFVVWVGVEPAFQTLYERSFVQKNDPVQIAAPPGLRHEPFTDREAMPAGRFQRTAFYQDWCRPQHIETVMGADIVRHAGGISLLGLGREDVFRRSDLALYRRLMPDLHRAMELRQRLLDTDVQRTRIRALLDAVSTPILLSDASARLLYANSHAETLLRSADPLGISQGRLTTVMEHDTAALRRFVRVAGEGCRGNHMHLATTDGGDAEIVIVPIRVDHAWAEGSANCVAIFVTRNSDTAGAQPELLRRLFGLTPAEAAVAAMVCKGRGLPATAEALGIGRATARTHLLRVFDKTGTRRQSQLAWMIKSLPGLAHT